ncbi:MAG: penicillin-binding transpeptidase domain-containing protein, partial [Candidatus Saccharimonadales bacterium]
VNHFMLGRKTGIDQGYESSGFVPSPNANGAGINLTYANTSFGQGVTATPLQMAAALASVLNGGTYYKPRLVSQIDSPGGQVQNLGPKIVKKNVVKPSTGQGLAGLMQYVMENRAQPVNFDQNKYTVGGKTGTAQIAKPNGGGYYTNQFNASFIGFVGGAKPQYVIIVYAYNPNTSGYSAGYAGELVAQPIFVNLAHMLIDNGYVAPKN